MREVYLKGFEVAVKTGQTTGIMSSFNRIGTTPTAESYALLTTVLRGEWGFKGAVITTVLWLVRQKTSIVLYWQEMIYSLILDCLAVCLMKSQERIRSGCNASSN